MDRFIVFFLNNVNSNEESYHCSRLHTNKMEKQRPSDVLLSENNTLFFLTH